MNNGKDWWKSVELWVNVIGFIGLEAQELAGAGIIDPATALKIIVTANVALRVFRTKEPIKNPFETLMKRNSE